MGSKLDPEAVAREVFSHFEFMAGVTPAEYELALTRAGALAALREVVEISDKHDIPSLQDHVYARIAELEREL